MKEEIGGKKIVLEDIKELVTELSNLLGRGTG